MTTNGVMGIPRMVWMDYALLLRTDGEGRVSHATQSISWNPIGHHDIETLAADTAPRSTESDRAQPARLSGEP